MLTYFITSALTLTASFLSTLRRRRWWVKVFDGMRLHLFVVMIFTLLYGFFFLPFWEPLTLGVQVILAMSVLYHATAIFPFTPLAKPEVKRGKSETNIRFFANNVRMSNRQYGRLLSLVEKIQPDVILLTETDQQWIDGVKKLEMEYPHTVLCPLDNTYGMALYSRLPMAKSEVNFLVEKDVPSIHADLLLEDGSIIQYIGLHPRPPAPWTKVENKDLELIIAAGMTNWNGNSCIVSGDLNDVGWSQITRQFKSISGMLDPRVGRGFFNTYNALIPFCRIPIDHFFVSPHFELVKMERLEKVGSDHFPVMLEVGLKKEN